MLIDISKPPPPENQMYAYGIKYVSMFNYTSSYTEWNIQNI